MFGTASDLLQLFLCLRLKLRIPQGNAVQTDNRIHRRSDFMADIRKKVRLCPARIRCNGFLNFSLPFPSQLQGVNIDQAHQGDHNKADLCDYASDQKLLQGVRPLGH